MYKEVEKSYLFKTLRMTVLSGGIYHPKEILHGVKRGNKKNLLTKTAKTSGMLKICSLSH